MEINECTHEEATLNKFRVRSINCGYSAKERAYRQRLLDTLETLQHEEGQLIDLLDSELLDPDSLPIVFR